MARMLTSVIGLTLILLLAGCGDNQGEQINRYQGLTQERLKTLGTMLDNKQIRNANLLSQYAQVLSAAKPQLTPLLDGLALDATTKGPSFTALSARLAQSKDSKNFIDKDQQLAEVENLYQASSPDLYNDMLSDPVNVIADMSNGQLARVNAISQSQSAAANQSQENGPGSQLVGNPSYGQWQTGSNGMSFWAWYGMYSMFSNLVNRPAQYDNWSRRRDYSYYNDVGRYRYTSPNQAKSQAQTYENTKKRFNARGQKFDSPYAKSRVGSTSLSRSSISSPKNFTQARAAAGKTSNRNNVFRSNYSKSSSLRNSRTRTTRGFRRGK